MNKNRQREKAAAARRITRCRHGGSLGIHGGTKCIISFYRETREDSSGLTRGKKRAKSQKLVFFLGS